MSVMDLSPIDRFLNFPGPALLEVSPRIQQELYCSGEGCRCNPYSSGFSLSLANSVKALQSAFGNLVV